MAEKTRLPKGLTRRGESYVVQYWDGHAWKRQAVGSELEAALEAHRKLRRETPVRASALSEKPSPAPVFTLQRLFERWLADQELRNKPRSVCSARDRARLLLETLGTEKPVASLCADDVARFVKARRKAGSSDVTVNAYLRILRAMLNWAANEELIERSPVRIRLLRTLDRKHVDVFTPEQIEEILEHAEPKIRLLVMIIAASGIRREEALHLQWLDVDFARARIDIRGKRYQHRRRDGSTVELVWTPKNYEERSVYVTPDVVRALQRFRSEQRWNAPEDWIFQSDRRRGQRWTSPTKPLHQAFKDAGVYERGKLLHAVRHTVGTRLLRATDLETARAQLGHRNIATTMKYLHTDEERRRKAGQAIGLLGGSRKS